MTRKRTTRIEVPELDSARQPSNPGLKLATAAVMLAGAGVLHMYLLGEGTTNPYAIPAVIASAAFLTAASVPAGMIASRKKNRIPVMLEYRGYRVFNDRDGALTVTNSKDGSRIDDPEGWVRAQGGVASLVRKGEIVRTGDFIEEIV